MKKSSIISSKTLKGIALTLFLQCSYLFSSGQLTLNVTITNTPACTHNGTASASVSNGNPPYSYVWYSLGGQYYTQSITGLSGGYYNCQVTDATGNTGYAYTLVPYPFTIYGSVTPDSCNLGNGSCSLSLTGGTAPYTFLWSNGATSNPLTGVSSGYYDCTITDANGCYMFLSDMDSSNTGMYIYSHSPINITFSSTPANCLNGTATAIPANGTAPYTYSWNTIPVQTTQTATGLHANNQYTVTVTDNTGCAQTGDVYISSSSNFYATVNTVPENCQYNNGTATAIPHNGTAPYSYLWSNNSSAVVISGLSKGYYTVTITDFNGCESIGAGLVSRISPITLSLSTVASSCTVNNGSVSVVASGGLAPYNYFWQTIPVQTTATAAGLGAGHYTVIVTDANLCSTSNSIQLPDVSNLALNVTATNDVCSQAIGTAIATATLGNPPYSFQWFTVPPQITSTATGLYEGWYHVSITDNSGCVRTGKSYVDNYSPVYITGGPVNASCIYTADGSITPVVSGGTPPYNYIWSNGTSNATATNLLTGYYYVYVTDASGCSAWHQYYVDYNSVLSCAVVISGMVYNDINGNCIQDVGEYPIANVAVQCSPNGGTEFTDATGSYEFVLAPGTYTVSHTVPAYFTQACPAGSYVLSLTTAGMSALNTDFADSGFVNDLAVNSYSQTLPVPGFNYHQVVSYVNKGSALTSGTVTISHDPQINFMYSVPMPSNYNGVNHTATYNVSNLYPDLYSNIDIYYNVPPGVLLGTLLNFQDTISPLVGDTFVYDNYVWNLESVVGSYDPNFIEVHPSGTGPQGLIFANDSSMEYVVHFQNTGTYPAQRVVVKIPLDTDLDPLTVQPGAASHEYSTEITTANELVFTFDNINLPDSNFNPDGSHGFISYKVKQMPNLAAGTQVTAQANIYFDFNAPVATNTGLNTIVIGVEDIDKNFSVTLQPNPSDDNVLLAYTLDFATKVSVQIYDVTGKSVYQTAATQKSAGEYSMVLSKEQLSFEPGVYFVKVSFGEKSVVKKMIRL